MEKTSQERRCTKLIVADLKYVHMDSRGYSKAEKATFFAMKRAFLPFPVSCLTSKTVQNVKLPFESSRLYDSTDCKGLVGV